MRRHDRAVTDMDAMIAILSKTSVCRLALHDTPYPYIVPMNFGYVRQGDTLTLYLHCAGEGKKLALLRANPHAAFEVEGACEVIGLDKACSYTMRYESVVGFGRLSIVEGEAKRAGLAALMRQVAPGGRVFHFDDDTLAQVTVLRLDVDTVTGKANR